MAHPLFLIEQAVRQFSSQWCAGLRPSLELQTKYDGSVVVNSKMFCSNNPPQSKNGSIFPFTSTPRSKRARKNARYRRNRAHKMRGLIPTVNEETQFSNNDVALSETDNVDSGFNNDDNISNLDKATASITSNHGNSNNEAERPAPQVISADEENIHLDDSVTTLYMDDALLNSSAARHNSESYLKEVVSDLEQYSDNSIDRNCNENDARDTVDVPTVKSDETEVKKVPIKKRKAKKPLEYSKDPDNFNWHKRWDSLVLKVHCAFCELVSSCENWKQFSKVAEYDKKGKEPFCKNCRRTATMYFTQATKPEA